MRAAALRCAGACGQGRATAFDLAGTGGAGTWRGTVTLPPDGRTAPHHHGTQEVAAYVSRGRSRIRWGDHLEYAAEVGAGDFLYFAPGVPHQELNLDPGEPVDFVVVRSNRSGFRVDLEIEPVGQPETVYWACPSACVRRICGAAAAAHRKRDSRGRQLASAAWRLP
jgi:uncharacterized RmlC-like cupin family protein